MAVSSNPHRIASEMFQKGLIGEDTKSRVVHTLGLSPYDKAGILVDMMWRRLATENSPKSLVAFFQILNRVPEMGSIAARMKATLGKPVGHLKPF